eukprot:scaffold1712_cov165-Ochromonas_danica.AAC.5
MILSDLSQSPTAAAERVPVTVTANTPPSESENAIQQNYTASSDTTQTHQKRDFYPKKLASLSMMMMMMMMIEFDE